MTIFLVSKGIIQLGQLFLALSILVFVHELGHFLAARAFGIRVKKFYLFFDFLFPLPNVLNFALLKFNWKGTEYGLGWFPLGGYVQIGGMVDESMDEEELKGPIKDDDYRAKPTWQKLIVLLGGIIMNVFWGIIFFAIYLGVFQKSYLSVNEFNKYGIYAYPLAQEYGFQTGDKITAINGKKPQRAEDILSYKILFGAKVTVDRNGKEEVIQLPGNLFRKVTSAEFIGMGRESIFADSILPNTPAAKYGLQSNDTLFAINGDFLENYSTFKTALSGTYKDSLFTLTVLRGKDTLSFPMKSDTAGKLGFIAGMNNSRYYSRTPYNAVTLFQFAVKDAFGTIITQAIGLSKIFTGDVPVRESVGGPIAMMGMFSAQWDWSRFWFITAMLSMVLAFMNFLPIPALDGGHIVIVLIEGIIRRPLPQKVQEIIQTVGTVIILALMLFTFGNDILRKFGI